MGWLSRLVDLSQHQSLRVGFHSPKTRRPMLLAQHGRQRWRSRASSHIEGREAPQTRDNSIPANLLAFMAERPGSKKTVTIEGAHTPS
jgi:hypothetical protein